ncbi:MAG: exosortase/archaeosortase family protein [Candidatus Micrarchaeota archaeon]
MWFNPRPKDSTSVLAFKFVSLFLLLFISSYFLLSLTPFPNHIAAIGSQLSLKLLFGLDSSIDYSSQFPQIRTPNISASILDLCSGALEIAVMFGIIFASMEKKISYRIKGFVAGLLLLLIFNSLRISTTIYYFNLGAIEWSAALHDFLFRIFLIVILVTYYAIWYFYDQPRKKRKRRR